MYISSTHSQDDCYNEDGGGEAALLWGKSPWYPPNVGRSEARSPSGYGSGEENSLRYPTLFYLKV
jgi:hypothetical protein